MPDWNPDQYLKFANQRTQPSIDLVARVNVENPRSIIDIGCGPGNSTRVLQRRWPGAKALGLDNSADMIKKAKEDYRDIEWITADASTFRFNAKYDIVFANAAIQWMPNHELLLPRLFEIVNRDGALAVQVPANEKSPLHQAVLATSSSLKWSGLTSGAENLITYHPIEYYYDILLDISEKFDIWETIYYHALNSHVELVEWYKGTGMRPFLERLPDKASGSQGRDLRKEFENEVLAECVKTYPIQKDGKVLYPFKRIFFVAYK
jgi:trans-aconitate 2-methyltransferase